MAVPLALICNWINIHQSVALALLEEIFEIDRGEEMDYQDRKFIHKNSSKRGVNNGFNPFRSIGAVQVRAEG